MTRRERDKWYGKHRVGRAATIAIDRERLGYRGDDCPRDKRYKNIYLFIYCMYIYISLISFFASPSVPLVSRTRICTKKKKKRKRNTRILPRARTRTPLHSLKENASPTTSSRRSRFHTRHPYSGTRRLNEKEPREKESRNTKRVTKKNKNNINNNWVKMIIIIQ